MIGKDDGKFYLVCDICCYSSDVDHDTFQDAVDAKQKEGFKARKRNGEWEDLCEECQKG